MPPLDRDGAPTSDDRRPVTDPDRLRTLRETGLLDSPREEAFDRLTRLAARVLDAPVSLVSLVDEDRQFFKSCLGLPESVDEARETPLSHSFCKHTVASGEAFVVEDARSDPRVAGNPAVEDLGVVAYAGIPLVTEEGDVLGSFCVIDHEPRTWTDEELTVLEDLAGSVMTEIELRLDVARRREIESELRRSEALNRAILASLEARICVLDDTGTIVTVNEPWTEHAASAGGTARLAAGEGVDYLEVCDRAGEQDESVSDAARGIRAVLAGEEDHYVTEYPCPDPETGEDAWFLMSVTPLEGADEGAVVAHIDITERKLYEREMRRRALHDPLTGLANRRLAYERIEQALARTRREGETLGLAYLDLDGFKDINDVHGHAVGDAVLEEVAERMEGCVRETDMVSRMGGDEFVVLLEGVDGDAGVAAAVERIRAALEAPVEAGGRAVPVSGSVGIVLTDGVGDGGELAPDDLVRHADLAMYRAKQGDAKGWHVRDLRG